MADTDLLGLSGSQSDSSNYGIGFGSTSGSSHEESGSQQSNVGDSWNSSSSDSYNTTFGREASAEDIARAKEANDLQYQWWKESLDYNTSEAEKQRQWQEYMSNTAYQRAVDDLIKAGLNPVLAAMNGGSSTPSGGYGSTSGATVHKATTYPQQEGRSHSESSGGSHSEGSGSSFSVGDSNNYGLNINLNSGQSHSESGIDTQINRVKDSLTNGIKKIFGRHGDSEDNGNNGGAGHYF